MLTFDSLIGYAVGHIESGLAQWQCVPLCQVMIHHDTNLTLNPINTKVDIHHLRHYFFYLRHLGSSVLTRSAIKRSVSYLEGMFSSGLMLSPLLV